MEVLESLQSFCLENVEDRSNDLASHYPVKRVPFPTFIALLNTGGSLLGALWAAAAAMTG